MKGSILFLLLTTCAIAYADPWGKDAELAYVKKSKPCCPKQRISTPILGQFGEMMIGFHQQVVSPADGPRSHFFPSSSQYTLDAMRKYGFFYGFTMGCDRLMRENDDPWVYQKYDTGQGFLKWNPVP